MPRPRLQDALKHATAGRLEEADGLCREILRENPTNLPAARLLGQVARRLGRGPESVEIFLQLRQLRPNDLPLIGELGASLTASEQPDRALPLLLEAVERMPKSTEWKIWLSRCFLKLFRTTAAINVLNKAREDDPSEPELLYHLANAMLVAASPAPAEPLIREYLQKRPGSIQGRVLLASILEHLDRLDEAIEICRRVLASEPGNDAAMGTLARCLRAEGKYDEALDALRPLVDAEPLPKHALALGPVYLSLKRFEECRELFEKALAHEHMPNPVRASLNLGLGDALQGLKRYDDAFEAYQKGNRLYPDTFSREKRQALYTEIRKTFSPEALKAGPAADVDGSRCVFVVGMPRSGTSLVEQIIDAHPRAFGAGELPEVPFILTDLCKEIGGPAPAAAREATPEQLTAAGRRYLDRIAGIAAHADAVVDKLPHNFEMLGLIRRMLPGAKIIHCTRNPIDTCVSCFCTQLSAWHSYSNDLSNLGWAYGQYLELMRYWREECGLDFLDVRYEEVVADLETQARRIVAHAGLEWDPRCLEFYKSDRPVTTASVDQVRRPIYTSSVARWKRFEPHLGPLIDALREARVPLPES